MDEVGMDGVVFGVGCGQGPSGQSHRSEWWCWYNSRHYASDVRQTNSKDRWP